VLNLQVRHLLGGGAIVENGLSGFEGSTNQNSACAASLERVGFSGSDDAVG
jgi:hypothetical protein